jgi:hypothetical protein
MGISRQVTNVINGVGVKEVVLVVQWKGLVEDIGAVRITRLDGVMPGQTEPHPPEETARLAFHLARGAGVYITLKARGAELAENVKAHGNIPGASPRDREEGNYK